MSSRASNTAEKCPFPIPEACAGTVQSPEQASSIYSDEELERQFNSPPSPGHFAFHLTVWSAIERIRRKEAEKKNK